MSVRGSCEGAKRLPWWAEWRCGMLFEIQGMLKLREQLNTLQTCEGGWEISYESGRIAFWKQQIELRLFPRTSQLAMVWVAKSGWRCVLRLWRQFILLTKRGSLSSVSLPLEALLLHRCLHHCCPSRPQRYLIIRISQTSARWWFYDRAREYSASIRSWTTLRPASSPFRQ